MIEKIILIIVIMIVVYFLIDNLFKTKQATTEESKLDLTKNHYTLQELADNLWLKNERKAMLETATQADRDRAEADKPEFLHQSTKDFWDNVIASDYNWIMNDERTGFHGLLEALKAVLLHLDDPKHASLSSVSSSYERVGNHKKEYDNECAIFRANNTFHIYSTFSILSHSLGVAEEIIPVIKGSEKGYMWGTKIGMALLCALGHDLGKIVRIINPDDNRTHEFISVSVIRDLLGNIIEDKKLDLIVNAISRHHMENTEDNPHFLITALVKADQNRRAEELKIYNNKEEGADTGVLLPQEEVNVEEISAKIVNHVLNLVETFDPTKNQIIFDKKKPQLIYVHSSEIETMAEKNKVNKEQLNIVLKSLRDKKIISLIDFSKYDSYKLNVRAPGKDKVHEYRVIPFDYTLIGLTEQIILDLFMAVETPKIVQNNLISSEKQ